MKVLDLFSGIGGFSLGLERAGMQTVAFCEIEPFCRKILRKHWPSVPIYEDVTKLTAKQLTTDGISVDVICGGFPCQDISTAGKGAGIEGSRSGLWKEYSRLVGELRPRYVIVENVAALLGRGLDVVLGDLAEIGYDAEWHCIPASAVGAPHRRDRVWIIASWQGMGGYAKGNSSGAERSLSEGADANAGRANPRTRPNSDADNPTPLAHPQVERSGGEHADGERQEQDQQDGVPRKSGGSGSDEGASPVADTKREGLEGQWKPRENGGNAGQSRDTTDPWKGGSVVADALLQQRDGGSDWIGWWSREPQEALSDAWRGRGQEDGVPVPQSLLGRVAHGVPSRVHRLKALGNAVVPQIPEIIGRAIMASKAEST